MQLCHTCDVPNCVNPAHLYVGTQYDNMQDRKNRGRMEGQYSKGEKHRLSKLSEKDALAIKYMEGSQSSIAKKYNVCQQTVGNIKIGKSWAHLA